MFCSRLFVTLPLKQIDTHARNKTKPYSQTAAERAEPHLPIANTHDAWGMVSVTKCRISPDLSICTAYLSIFPSDKGEEIVKNVNANVKTIRYELGTRVRNQLRIIPELRFFIDDSLDYIEHIDELLKK